MKRPEKIWIAIVILVFLTLRLGFPIVFTGSFIDEYFHLVGALPGFDDGGYDRGEIVTISVSVLSSIFGKSIYVGKMVPALLGMIDLCLFFFLVRRLVEGWWPARPLALMAFTFSPWVVFNHFYIRMYVFLEFSVLAVLASIAWADQALEEGRRNTGYARLLPSLVLALAYLFLNGDLSAASGGDASGFLPIGVWGLCATSLFVTHGLHWAPAGPKPLRWLLSGPSGRAVLVAAGTAIGLLVTSAHKVVLSKLSADLSKLGGAYETDRLVLPELLFRNNTTLLLLFAVGAVWFVGRGSAALRAIAITATVLLVLHNLTNGNEWMVRTILYLFPVLYLVAFAALARLRISAVPRCVFVIFLALELIWNIPAGFLKGPHLPHEVQYREYAEAFAMVAETPNATLFTAMAFPRRVAMFYDADVEARTRAIRASKEELRGLLDRFKSAPQPAFLLLDSEAVGSINQTGLQPEFFNAGFVRHQYLSYLFVLER